MKGIVRIEGRGYIALSFVAVIVLLVVVPLVVNILFGSGAPFPVFAAEYEAGSLLAYYGSVSACIGTVVLAVITIRQTSKIEEQNKKLEMQRSKWERENTKRPFFMVDFVLYGQQIQPDEKGDYQYSCPSNRINLGPIVRVRNIGDGPAINVRVEPETAFGELPRSEGRRLTCMPGKAIEVRVSFEKPDGGSGELREVGALSYENMLGQGYLQRFEASVSQRATSFVRSGFDYSSGAELIGPEDYVYTVQFKPIGCQEVRSNESF